MPESRPVWLGDVSQGDWIASRVHGFAVDVGSLVPADYQAYARVFHPVRLPDGTTERWAQVARRNGRLVHPEMQLHMIERPVGSPLPANRPQGQGLDYGNLPRVERTVLVETLRPATATPDRCWFCVWEGWGGLDDASVVERVRLPGRDYLLTHGPIERALDSFHPGADQAPSLWWPDDRAWVVATEIDLAWTYVAGSRSVIDALLRDDRIEALEAQVSDRFTYDSDHPNTRLDSA